MPLVRIDLKETAPPDRGQIVGDVVYKAMVEVAKVPANDKFQIITRHNVGEIVYPAEGYLGINYTDDLVFIQITWNGGRSVETKKEFYKSIADGVSDRCGMRREDVWINLVEVTKENWSFGNGEMQYATK